MTYDLRLTTGFADVIYDHSGQTLKGLVVEEHHDRIVLSTEQGEKTILRDGIDEVFYDEPERNHLYLGNQALEEGELDLARGFFQRALQIHPQFQEAEDALGRLKDLEGKVGWLIPARWESILEAAWGISLEARGAHVAVREVRAASPAERSGLKAGDRLVGYWGQSLLFYPAREVAARLLGPRATKVKITLQREIHLSAAASEPSGWPWLQLGMSRLGLTVLEAEPGSPAAEAGMNPQDRIVELAGKPTRYMRLAHARRAMMQAAGAGISFWIERDIDVQRE